ncbi:MAG: B12-binding domain-containing radical SAM protein [Treponema sp.]|nr:B12-binding domain-containing radical SAM protein [Treponema sp.]
MNEEPRPETPSRSEFLGIKPLSMNNPEGGILLAAINAKWIHPSLALRLLKANLGPLENRCTIMEFALRQPLREKSDPILAAKPRILGLSVSIWNHTATLELLGDLHSMWGQSGSRPYVVLGGPEVSYLPPEAEIFRYADYCIRGEGEVAFRELCAALLSEGEAPATFINRELQQINLLSIKSGYHLYTDEDLRRKLIYVEASRGCPYGCEFCQSAGGGADSSKVREFPLEPFLAGMDDLARRGARTFKFLDRTFNLNIKRARQIMEFFLEKIAEQAESRQPETPEQKPLVVHFEMVPFRFPPELLETIARFPPGTLRLEIGIQTLNPAVAARIGRQSDPEQELALLRLLRKTNAIIHADLIAGLPGEDMDSFAAGFDLLCEAVFPAANSSAEHPLIEIQLGILKLLPGTPIVRHAAAYGMRYNPLPPYELTETSAIPEREFDRIKNFARFWEIIVNRGLIKGNNTAGQTLRPPQVFNQFMALSDSLFAHFGRSWGIAKNELIEALQDLSVSSRL